MWWVFDVIGWVFFIGPLAIYIVLTVINFFMGEVGTDAKSGNIDYDLKNED